MGHRATPRSARLKRTAIVSAAIVAFACTPGALAAGGPSGRYRTTITGGDEKGTWTITITKTTHSVRGPFPGVIKGTTSISGSTITFDNESNPKLDDTCGKANGKYRFKATAKALQLTKISDSCVPRRRVFAHRLIRLR